MPTRAAATALWRRRCVWSSVDRRRVRGHAVSRHGPDPLVALRRFEAGRAFSTFGNPNLLGGLLVFAVPVALAWRWLEARTCWRLAYWAGLRDHRRRAARHLHSGRVDRRVRRPRPGVRHRVAEARPPASRRPRPGGVVAAMVTVVVVARALASTSEVTNIGKRLASIFDFSAGSGQTRTEIWQAALDAIKARPVTGWGADTFGLVFPRYSPPEYVRDAGFLSLADNAHNYPLQLAATLGVPGVLLSGRHRRRGGDSVGGAVFGRADARATLVLGAFWAAAAGYLRPSHGRACRWSGSTFLLWVGLRRASESHGASRRGRCADSEVAPMRWRFSCCWPLPWPARCPPWRPIMRMSRRSTGGNGGGRIDAAERASTLNPWVARLSSAGRSCIHGGGASGIFSSRTTRRATPTLAALT